MPFQNATGWQLQEELWVFEVALSQLGDMERGFLEEALCGTSQKRRDGRKDGSQAVDTG